MKRDLRERSSQSRGGLGRVVAYWGGVVLLFGSLGAATGQLVMPDEAGDGPPGQMVFGREKVDSKAPADEEARRIARAFAQGTVKLHTEGFRRELTRERLGLHVEQGEVKRLIEEWRDPASTLRRFREASGATGSIAVPVPVRMDREIATRTLMALKEEFDTDPSDAHIDISKQEIVRDRVGRRMELYSTMSRLEWSARGEAESVEIAVVEVAPRVRYKSIADVRFDDALGWFETPYSQMRKDRHRTYNLELAAKSLNGQILMPGEVFSFNDVVGERSEARGYRVAHVIAAGELVDGMGGGTCQIAGTLHAAAFFAGLEVVERQPHSRPSSYIRIGLDATVSYPNIDLKLRNPFEFPVVLGMSVAEGKVRGEVLGPERELTVTYIRNILEIREPPTRTIEDDSMPRGVKTVDQRGVPGFKVRRFRIFSKGTIQWRHEGLDRYPPTPHVVRVGTNPALAPPEEPREPPSPFPDPCNMRIIQGPDGLFDEQTACHR